LYGRFGTGRRPGAQVEKKFYDTTLALPAGGLSASTSQATGQINLTLAQGTGVSARIGQKIIIKSIQIKLTATLAAGAVDTDNVHVWLVQDSQCNGANAASTLVFDNVGPVGSQLRNIENGARFRILKHFVFQLNADAGVAAAFGGDEQQQDCYIKCNIPIVYNSTAGAIAEIRSNNLFMVWGMTAATATVAGRARIRYTDQ